MGIKVFGLPFTNVCLNNSVRARLAADPLLHIFLQLRIQRLMRTRYTLFHFLGDAYVKDGSIPMLHGDPATEASDRSKTTNPLRQWWIGMQNERGRFLMRFVVAKGFHIYSWQNATENRGAS